MSKKIVCKTIMNYREQLFIMKSELIKTKCLIKNKYLYER